MLKALIAILAISGSVAVAGYQYPGSESHFSVCQLWLGQLDEELPQQPREPQQTRGTTDQIPSSLYPGLQESIGPR